MIHIIMKIVEIMLIKVKEVLIIILQKIQKFFVLEIQF